MPMKIEEFAQKLEIMEKQYPADASDALERAANRMTRKIRKATPYSGKHHKHVLRKSWEKHMVDTYSREPRAEIRSTAPHFHLVNRGVQNPKDAHGNPKPEWKAGLNKNVGFLEKTVKSNWPDVKDKMAKDFYKKVRGHFG